MKQLQDHKDPKNVQVNMSTAVMKEPSAQWLTVLHDDCRGCPELISNGFRKAGVAAAALEDQGQPAELSDEDPFADLV